MAANPHPPRVDHVEIIQDAQLGEPGVIWADDFEDTINLSDSYHEVNHDGGRFGLTAEDAFGGSVRSVRQLYDQGQINAGWIWYFFADHPHLAGGERQTEIYARWYHKFEEGFQGHPPKMARLGGFAFSDWTLSFMAHYWIGDESELVLADVASNIERQGSAPVHRGYNNFVRWLPVAHSTFDFGDPVHNGRWICHEMRVKLNSPFQSDGAYQYWADGELIIDIEGRNLVGGYVERGINAVQWDCYWNDGSPAMQSRYYDNVVVGTAPIGAAFSSANPVVRKSPFSDPDPGDFQTGWHLQVASDHDGSDIVWDSAVIEGDGDRVTIDASNGTFSGSLQGADRLQAAALYWCRVRQRDASNQWSQWSPWHSVTRVHPDPIGIGDGPPRVTSIAAGANMIINYPNPFSRTTSVVVGASLLQDLREGVRLPVRIYSAQGRLIRILNLDRRGSAVWDGHDQSGRPAPSGHYFFRIPLPAGVNSRPMLLLR
jgi:hypothetical protein